jgi:glycosyltransferase involved in cell wall biosynthesis
LCGLPIKCDVIVATSPQFFAAISGWMLGFFKRTHWIMEVRDLWPESIKAVDAVKSTWVIKVLEEVELFLYRNAHKIVVVTDSFKRNLINRGIRPDKVHVVKNGVDISKFRPNGKNKMILEKYGLQGKFIVGYIGTHGLAHSLDFIVRSISKVTDPSIHFVFIGEGAEKANIVKISEELALLNITFIEPVEKSEIHNYLSILDIALVPLRRTITFESVIPSKVFESVAMNLPILLGVNGETRGIIETYNAGLFFEPENESQFVDGLIEMKKNIQQGNPYIDGCRRMAFDFDRKNLAKKMLSIISK